MEGFKQECKLCDNLISDENFEVIGNVIKTIFDASLLKLTLDNDNQNVMCTVCSSKLLAASNFKSTCLHTDHTIMPYVDFENPTLVDLKEIYRKEEAPDQLGGTFDNQEICRLCFHPINSDFKAIQAVPHEIIETYIPEINFCVTTNPVICIECHDALCVHSSFIRNCLEVQKKRNIVAVDVGDTLLTDACIKTEEMEIKDEQIVDVTVSEILCKEEKQEYEERYTYLHTQNGLIDTAETESLYDPEDIKPTSAEWTNHESKECTNKSTPENCEIQPNKIDGGNRENKRRYSHRNQPKSIRKGPKVREYKCDECVYHTKYRWCLERHQLVHKDPRDVPFYTCDECGYRSTQKGTLNRHKLTHKHPSQVYMYMCDKCDYATKLKACLKQHELKHTDPSQVQTYQCDGCDYKSTKKSNLKRHRLRHEEVQTYQCDECDYETKYKKYFKSHLLRHKSPAEAQVYMCDKCKFITKHKGSLIQHMLVHKDPSEVRKYTCDECDYKSTKRYNMKSHQLRHRNASEVQMYQCDECDYSTKYKHHLKNHLLRHRSATEVRMFECDKCKFATKRKKNLKLHQSQHATRTVTGR